jgi:hypothetical protein
MILDYILENQDLFCIRRETISDQGVEAEIHGDFLDLNGNLLSDKICILKLDAYCAYNSKYTPNPPQVIDNLVIVKCCDGSISIHMIELRCSCGRNPTRRLNPSEILGKFITAANDFIGTRYAEIFKKMSIKDVKAYLVSDPWQLASRSDGGDLFKKKIKLSSLDAYSSMKPINVLGRSVLINPVMPPQPIIKGC